MRFPSSTTFSSRVTWRALWLGLPALSFALFGGCKGAGSEVDWSMSGGSGGTGGVGVVLDLGEGEARQ
jgi:hypothetical protein